jgi:hypothetical protein
VWVAGALRGWRYSDGKVANRYVGDFGWEVAHEAISRGPPISLYTVVPRTEGYTYEVRVRDLSIVQGPFSVPNAKPFTLRFANCFHRFRRGTRTSHAERNGETVRRCTRGSASTFSWICSTVGSFSVEPPLRLVHSASCVHSHTREARPTAMRKLRIVTVGISGGGSLTRPLRDVRRFPSTRL